MDHASRGFPKSEFESRVQSAQAMLGAHGLDALLLTTHPDIYYFSGFLTRFWESPTRPWFLLLPQTGEPIAVIPTIGADLMTSTGIEDIRTWASPDLYDDGVSLLGEAIRETVGTGRVAIPSGPETHLRMPLQDFERLRQQLKSVVFESDQDIVRDLRMVKSPLEQAKIARACDIASIAFEQLPNHVNAGMPLSDVFRQFQILCLQSGADAVPYLAGGAGQDGYLDVISPANDAPLNRGDILMLDTGLVWDGYFCDFDRNLAIGATDRQIAGYYERLIEATQAAADAARPGIAVNELFKTMDTLLTGGQAPAGGGRMGHGLGIQLTEPPSLMPDDHTILTSGMVITLEPWISTRNGCILVHEENLVITPNGSRFLSTRAGKRLTQT